MLVGKGSGPPCGMHRIGGCEPGLVVPRPGASFQDALAQAHLVVQRETYDWLPCSTAKQLFDETIPDTITYFDGPHPVEGGWREFQTYYDMRDLMEMYYLR